MKKAGINDADALNNIFRKQKVQVKFFVALTDDACRNYAVLKSLKQTVPHVGIIRYDDHCESYIRDGRKEKDKRICESQQITIPIERKYDNRKEFLHEVEQQFVEKHPSFKVLKLPGNDPRYLQFKFGSSHFHLEVGTTGKAVRIAMDIEPQDKETTKKFFKFLRNKKIDLSSIEALEWEEKRGKTRRWGALCVRLEHQGLTYSAAMKSVSILEQLDSIVSPIIRQFEASEE